jgi:hypothetical protein
MTPKENTEPLAVPTTSETVKIGQPPVAPAAPDNTALIAQASSAGLISGEMKLQCRDGTKADVKAFAIGFFSIRKTPQSLAADRAHELQSPRSGTGSVGAILRELLKHELCTKTIEVLHTLIKG